MNSIFQWAVGLVTAVALSRTCPTCGKVQVVPRQKKAETVPCTRCGTPIPPKETLS